MVTMAGLSSWLCLGKSMVLVCATAAGAWGQPRGHLQPMAAFARGRVLLLGCCAALPCLVISRSPQLGRFRFGIPQWSCISRTASLVPLESRHRPQVIFLLKHSRKARGF